MILGAVYFTQKDRQFQHLRTVYFQLGPYILRVTDFCLQRLITVLISKKYEKFEFRKYFFFDFGEISREKFFF